MVGFTDTPTKKLSRDKFGLDSYITGLSSFILECDTPMTIAIQGEWGSGKTSMMNMVRESLGSRTVSVWFNTWQFSQFNMGDRLPIFFMSSLIESFGVQNDKSEGLNENLVAFKSILGKIAVIATGAFAGDKAAEVVEKTTARKPDGIENNMAKEISNIKVQFQKCVDMSLKAQDKDRIVIFMDDLDRLQPSKAVELLEVLKLFLDCEKCVFVLAIDYQVVLQGVSQKYGTAIGEAKGRSFFDKIIQVPFKMPVAQYNVSEFVINMLKNIGIDCKDNDEEMYTGLIKSSIDCNPRSMKRLFNAFLLLTKVAQDETLNNPWKKKVLFGILCLQFSFENVYNYLANNRKGITEGLLMALSDKDKFENYEDYSTLKKEFVLDDDDDLSKLVWFMKNFVKIIDKDGDKDFSDDEIDDFVGVLGFSTITSTSKNSSVENDAVRMNYRRQNREIVKKVNSRLADAFQLDFSIYQSHNDSGDWKFYYANGNRVFCKGQKAFSLEYAVKTDLGTKLSGIDIKIVPKSNTSTADLFSFPELNNLEKSLQFVRNESGYIKEYPLINENTTEFLDMIFDEVTKVIGALSGCVDRPEVGEKR